jgi:hypothetical protein
LQDNLVYPQFVYAEFDGILMAARSMASIVRPKRQHSALMAGCGRLLGPKPKHRAPGSRPDAAGRNPQRHLPTRTRSPRDKHLQRVGGPRRYPSAWRWTSRAASDWRALAYSPSLRADSGECGLVLARHGSRLNLRASAAQHGAYGVVAEPLLHSGRELPQLGAGRLQ